MANNSSSGIYMDNAASAPVSAEILEFFKNAAIHSYCNQEAIHGAAYDLRKELEHSANVLCEFLCGTRNDAEVIWADSGTTAINTALMHPQFQDAEIITTDAEHAAMSEALARTSTKIHKVKLVNGMIDLEHFNSLLNDKVKLIAVHHVQSETGVMQDIIALRRVMDSKSSKAVLMVDTIQSAGKLDIPWRESRIDYMFVSGCKVGAPGGAAVIYRDLKYNGVRISSFYESLRKDKHLLSRANPLISLTLTEAVRGLVANQMQNLKKVQSLSSLFINEFKQSYKGNILWTARENQSTPYIIHFILPGYQGAVLVRMLSAKNIYIASGSACNAETKTPSKALIASGISAKNVFSGLRISLSPDNTKNEIECLVNSMVSVLRDY